MPVCACRGNPKLTRVRRRMEWSLDNNFVSEQGHTGVTRDHTYLAITVSGHYFENQLDVSLFGSD